MADSAVTQAPRTFPVTLADSLLFFAQSWKLTANRLYTEQLGCAGTVILTNAAPKAKRLLLSGGFPLSESAAAVLTALDTLLQTGTALSFSLRGIQVTDAVLVRYEMQESGTEFLLPCQLEFALPQPLSEVTADA